jgi:septum site-determining protein MinC
MALAPEPPVAGWLAELDAWLERSPGFFDSRPIVLDLFSRKLSKSDLEELIKSLGERKIQVMGLEGADPAWAEFGLPPLLASGNRPANAVVAVVEELNADAPVAPSVPPAPARPNSLLLDSPIRSGQCIENLQGDVIVIGSVASGAEVVAGGSIHIYGTLRGRAIAGAGDPRARIFCRKLEAELLAIDGLYMTADDMEPHLRGRPVQVWLNGDSVMMTAQD